MTINRQFVKEDVVRMHEQGIAPARISQRSGVPLTTVRRWIVESDPDYHQRNLENARLQREAKQRDMRAVLALDEWVLSPAEIADRLKLSRRRVHRLLAQHRGTCKGEGECRPYGDRLRAKMAALRKCGLDMRTIRDLTGRSLGTVHYHLRKVGLHGRLDSAKRRAAKGNEPDSCKTSPRKTGRPAELWTCALLTELAEHPDSPITWVDHSPNDQSDIHVVIGVYALRVQVRTASWRGNSLHASITRYGGRSYGPENCDLLFGYDERTRALYCRTGTDVWKRSSSIAFRPQDAVSSEHPEHTLRLIDAALEVKLRWLKEKPQSLASSRRSAADSEAEASVAPMDN